MDIYYFVFTASKFVCLWSQSRRSDTTSLMMGRINKNNAEFVMWKQKYFAFQIKIFHRYFQAFRNGVIGSLHIISLPISLIYCRYVLDIGLVHLLSSLWLFYMIHPFQCLNWVMSISPKTQILVLKVEHFLR